MLLVAAVLLLILNLKSAVGDGEISVQKCQEYAKAVFVQRDSPVLMRGSGKISVSECGITSVRLIVGGVTAQPKEFPHMAAVGFGMTPISQVAWQCGGALISELFVLTAAHCLYSRENGPAQKVKLGTTYLDSENDGMTQIIDVVDRLKHPGYMPPSKYNDIALLRLQKPAQFTAYVRPACINVNPTVNSRKVIAAGFGKTFYGSSQGSKNLMKVELNLIPNQACSKTFSSGSDALTLRNGITDNLLCAGELQGGKDTCQGDSGGPLQIVLPQPYCMYSIIAVTSFGKFCGFANSPAVYSRVSSYVGWIENIVWGIV